METSKLSVCTIVLGLLAFSTASLAESALGIVTAQGKINIKSATSNIVADLVDTSYTYFDGDVLYTNNNSQAMLELSDGNGYVLIEVASTANVDNAADTYSVKLDRGSIIFTFKSGTDFNITANGKQIQPDFDQQIKLASTSSSKWVSGRIELTTDSGDVEFQSIAGDYVFSDLATNASQPVLAGETLLAQVNELPVVMKTQAGGGGTGNPNLTPLLVFLASLGIILGSDASNDSDPAAIVIPDNIPPQPPVTTTGGGGGGGGGGGTTRPMS